MGAFCAPDSVLRGVPPNSNVPYVSECTDWGCTSSGASSFGSSGSTIHSRMYAMPSSPPEARVNTTMMIRTMTGSTLK